MVFVLYICDYTNLMTLLVSNFCIVYTVCIDYNTLLCVKLENGET